MVRTLQGVWQQVHQGVRDEDGAREGQARILHDDAQLRDVEEHEHRDADEADGAHAQGGGVSPQPALGRARLAADACRHMAVPMVVAMVRMLLVAMFVTRMPGSSVAMVSRMYVIISGVPMLVVIMMNIFRIMPVLVVAMRMMVMSVMSVFGIARHVFMPAIVVSVAVVVVVGLGMPVRGVPGRGVAGDAGTRNRTEQQRLPRGPRDASGGSHTARGPGRRGEGALVAN
mmetsp:Transcript_111971/g.321744  ORF Transcript_111971/g.321744 Transcript_111971/m.321744 type:complete len:229 (-) Transcript_111971:13-699(-)